MNWRNLIFHNLGWKVLSLMIAVLIMAGFRMGEGKIDIGSNLFKDKVTKEFIGYQIQLLSEQKNSQPVILTPEDVHISLSGTAEAMSPVTINDVLAYVDISNLSPGTTNSVPITVKVPHGIQVAGLYPTNITVLVVTRTSEPVKE